MIATAPYSSTEWHIKDYDGDGYDERYLLVGEYYYQWFYGKTPSIEGHHIRGFGNYEMQENYGWVQTSTDTSKNYGTCPYQAAYTWKSDEMTVPSDRIYSFQMSAFGEDKDGNWQGWGWNENHPLSRVWKDSDGNEVHREYYHVLSQEPTYSIDVATTSKTINVGESANYAINLEKQGVFSAPVYLSCTGLPTGTSCSFSSNDLVPTSSTTLTVQTSSSTPAGVYTITIRGNGGGDEKSTSIILEVSNRAPYVPEVSQPVDGATSQVTDGLELSWNGGDPDGDNVVYNIYVDSNSNPTTLVGSTGLTSFVLEDLTYNSQYFWKIVVIDNHGASTEGPVWTFTTENAPETIPPTVISSNPTGMNIPVNSQIIVTFSEGMNQESAESAFYTSPATTGSFSWSGSTMTYIPAPSLHALQDYV